MSLGSFYHFIHLFARYIRACFLIVGCCLYYYIFSYFLRIICQFLIVCGYLSVALVIDDDRVIRWSKMLGEASESLGWLRSSSWNIGKCSGEAI